ncbi:substrate-binding periplasmic protein [Aeromonas veronii]|uniref:substrate-binding periplasmic protein n=1 Tax=Aeromonas veronii TaxID=654 RepID=UPI003D1B24FE
MLHICLLLCCLCTVVNCRADSIEVYCDDWPGFCQQDGNGIYLDLVRAIYQPHGYQVTPHIVPYKRALAVIAKKGGDMAMGVYRDEVTGVRQPRYPASADDLTVFMLKKWQPKWQGEKSLQGQSVVWRRGWAFDKYIAVTMQWHEIDSDEMALQLLGKERYRYYLTAGVLYANEDIPANLHRAFLRWIPTYPIFADTPQGNRMLQLWDKGMVELIRSGTLADIYKHYQLYDYYQGFIRELEQKATASPTPE